MLLKKDLIKMELQNSVNYSNYISINELIKIFDKKYELFEEFTDYDSIRKLSDVKEAIQVKYVLKRDIDTVYMNNT